jgi:hypothetical protein
LALAAQTASVLILGAPGATASPQALYIALVTTAYPDSQLPSGSSSAKVSVFTPSGRARKYHVVGDVYVTISGPDPDDGILYLVFANRANAARDFSGATPNGKGHKVGKVPGYSIPSAWFTGSIPRKNAVGKSVTYGITAMTVQDGSVVVAATTDSSGSMESGNVPAALALLKSALRHLHAVESAVTRKG